MYSLHVLVLRNMRFEIVGIMAATAAALAIPGLYAAFGKPKKEKTEDKDKSLQKKRRRKLNGFTCPGLLNLGNTCFMNSVLQALASVQGFVEWIANVVGDKSEINDLGTTVYDAINGGFDRGGEECSLYSPSPVIESLQAHGWVFEGQQQDAHELFHVLTSTLQEEKGQTPSVLSLNDMQLVQKDEGQMFVEGAVHRSQVPLRSLTEDARHSLPFHGLLASEMICKDCGYKAPVKYDAFDSLSLCLPQYPRISRNGLSLHDLLMRFVQSEVIRNVDCISCSKAIGSHHASIQKTFIRRQTLGKLPQCLCIHVQRTYWNNMGLPFKNNTFFSFPEYLNVSHYTYNTSRTVRKPPDVGVNLLLGGNMTSLKPGLRGNVLAGLRGSWTHTSSASIFNSIALKPARKPKFKLMAVISHAGSVDSGHFVAYRRLICPENTESSWDGSTDKWVCISDESVNTSSLSEVLKCKAYMLFYE